ncbi:VanZ family protein [Cryobacterium sp. TMS1-20-1]|uniref:VanZ family protein n=1 Tax=Cryobacterium sp. TMS1-20-1 TaxID=1259223 RepID=UPI00141BC424|nr:VanZ family protein [Cryobacterium sp. TMS1-20-1]
MIAYGLVVLLATLWPTPLDQGYDASIQKFLGVLHRNGIPDWFGYGKLEFTSNVAMFVPLGFLTALILPTRVWWLVFVLCPGLSIAIELTQASLLAARFATYSDILANSIGAVLGALIAVILRALIYQRDEKLIARTLWCERYAARSVRAECGAT